VRIRALACDGRDLDRLAVAGRGKSPEAGATVSTSTYQPNGWMAATVPGTVLTSMVNDGVYPEPFYGENNRETIIPESLNKTRTGTAL